MENEKNFSKEMKDEQLEQVVGGFGKPDWQRDINVVLISGRRIGIQGTIDTTILEIKQTVAAEANIPIDQQRLVYQKQLDDNQTLGSAGIPDGAELHMIQRLRGA